MKQEINWKHVSDTLLIPLYCRARETNSKEPIIRDEKALEIFEDIKSSISGSEIPIHRKIVHNRYNYTLVVSLALRTRKFDRYVADFIERYPDATIVNLGCGLDSRYQRQDNGTITWYDLDLPEVIGIKKHYFTETDRYHFLPVSATEPEWIDRVQKTATGHVMILAEGLFMYLEEHQTKNLILTLRDRFPGCELVFENTAKFWVERMNSRYFKWKFKRQLGYNEEAMFTFGFRDHHEVESIGGGIRFLGEWSYFDDRHPKMGWMNLFGRFRGLRHVQWVMHFKLDRP
jgi:O-methyltransferase involved in polyketide biosynthesis